MFTQNGKFVSGPVRTLKESLSQLASSPPAAIGGHAQRGDFSRWIADVFRDHFLASDIRKLEQRYRLGHIHDISDSLIRLVRERYQVSSERIPSPPNSPTHPALDMDLAEGAPLVSR